MVEVQPKPGAAAPQPSVVVADGAAVLLEPGQAALVPRPLILGCDLQGSRILAPPQGGRAAPRGSALLYQPDAGFAGEDSFVAVSVCAGRDAGTAIAFRATVKPPKPLYRLTVSLAGAGSGR